MSEQRMAEIDRQWRRVQDRLWRLWRLRGLTDAEHERLAIRAVVVIDRRITDGRI